jgi:hypothetical protein
MTALPDRRIVVSALGITQIFAWGSTFYLPAALAPLIARDTGWPYDLTERSKSVAIGAIADMPSTSPQRR